jgi:protein-disulfide isomerase
VFISSLRGKNRLSLRNKADTEPNPLNPDTNDNRGVNFMDMDTPELNKPITSEDHSLGPETAPVSLVEYGDYECPYCREAYFVVAEALERLGNNLRYVFRNFPLIDVHPHAEQAAQAAEAAGAQGQFWQMHALLFENQDALEDEDLIAYAQALDLDIERFRDDLATGKYAPRVQQDLLSGIESGVSGTPAFFINGFRYEGPRDALSEVLGELVERGT